MPSPLPVGMRVLVLQGIGEGTGAIAFGQVLLAPALHPLQEHLQRGDEAVGRHGHPVFHALTVTHDDRPLSEVEVLDAQPQALHQPQAGAGEELGHQFVDAVQVAQKAQDLVAGEDGGEALGPFGRREEDGSISMGRTSR